MSTPVGERETRFLHLLNPIRDLAKNMSIDIALYLEDYLEELEKVTISFDNGQSSMDFVKAALLIQNSTVVYSKKVDFLYNMVLQLLEILRSKKKGSQAQQLAAQGTSSNSDPFDDWEELEDADELLPVDPTAHQEVGDENILPLSRLLLPLCPSVLVPLSKEEKGDTMLYDMKGQQIGNKNDFKVNSYCIHPLGALVFDLSWMPQETVRSLPCVLNNDAMNSLCNNDPGADNDNDDSDVGGAGDPAPTTFNGPDSADDDEPPEQPAPEPPIQKLTAEEKERQKAQKILTPLNPHNSTVHLNRQARKGKTVKIPKLPTSTRTEPSLTRPRTRSQVAKSQTKDIVEEQVELEQINNFCNNHFFSHAPKFPSNFPKDVLMPSLHNMYYENLKAEKTRFKELFAEDGDSDGHEDKAESDESNLLGQLAVGNDDAMDNDSIGDDDFGDAVVPEEEELLVPHRLVGTNANFDEIAGLDGGQSSDSSYEDLVRKHTEEFLKEVRSKTKRSESAQRVQVWQEKMSAILDEEETHKPFDIHVCSTKVLERFGPSPSKQTLSFSQIVKGATRSETAQYFLSTLQLANNYNVEISRPDPDTVSGFDVTLLSRRQHFEELDEFQTNRS